MTFRFLNATCRFVPGGGLNGAIVTGPRKKPRNIPLPPSSHEAIPKSVWETAIKNVAVLESSDELHPLAAQFLKALKAIKPDERGLTSYRETGLFEVHASKSLVDRMAKAFHVLLNGLETVVRSEISSTKVVGVRVN